MPNNGMPRAYESAIQRQEKSDGLSLTTTGSPKLPSCVVFGRNVRRLRIIKEISQENFASRCDLHRTYIGSVERGEVNISVNNMDRIADALGMEICDLLRRDLQIEATLQYASAPHTVKSFK